MHRLTFHAADEAATGELGRALAKVVKLGSVIGLNGPLGAGKTRLVQATAEAMGVPREAVTSPTFVMINEYPQGDLPLYHFDAYRVRDLDEFAELGPEEYFFGPGVCLIEWAERVADSLPADRLEINIEVIDTDTRQFEIVASGQQSAAMLADLESKLR